MPDAVLRFACVVWLKHDAAMTPGWRDWLRLRLQPTADGDYGRGFAPEELARLVPRLLAWLETYDARCATVVRLALAGAENKPWHGHRSTEGLVQVAAIVERIREEQAALPERTSGRRRRR